MKTSNSLTRSIAALLGLWLVEKLLESFQAKPTSAEELDAATSIGLLTARRLAPEILPLLE